MEQMQDDGLTKGAFTDENDTQPHLDSSANVGALLFLLLFHFSSTTAPPLSGTFPTPLRNILDQDVALSLPPFSRPR